jgi:hypothetical protein
MKNEIAASAVKVAPPISVNIWQWVGSHDANWYLSAAVSLATLAYIVMQMYYLRRNKGRTDDDDVAELPHA